MLNRCAGVRRDVLYTDRQRMAGARERCVAETVRDSIDPHIDSAQAIRGIKTLI